MLPDSWLYPPAILFSVTLVLLAYAKVSRFDRSWLNCLTVPVGFSVLTTYLFEIGRILYFEHAGYSVLGLVFCYSLTPAYFWGIAAAYTRLHVRAFDFTIGRSGPLNLRLVAYALLGLAWVMFVPVLMTLAPYGLNPRAIYAHIGETQLGSLYFASSALARLGLICFFLVPSRSRFETALFCVGAVANVILHGSQGQIISVIAIGLFLAVYVAEKKFRLWTIMAMVVMAVIFVTISLLFLFGVKNSEQAFTTVASYSDYVGNSAALIDRQYFPQWGWITLQDNIIGHIPRLFWPEKPSIFGMISVSASVRPYEATLGYYPAFLFGEECADFGLLALPVILLEGAFAGLIMRACRNTLLQRKSPFAAILFLYFSGGALLSLGIGSTFIDQLILAVAVQFVSSIRLFPSPHRATASEKAAPIMSS